MSKNAGKYLSALTFLENCPNIIDKAKVCIKNGEDTLSRKRDKPVISKRNLIYYVNYMTSIIVINIMFNLFS
jgi:hypothetical protein